MGLPIPEGFDLLPNRSRDNARKAIALAEERGYDSFSVLSRSDGYLIPLGEGDLGDVGDAERGGAAADAGENVAVAQPIVFPDPEKDSHAVIDEWAKNFPADLGGEITFDGIEAADAAKPTKAEKVAHLEKVVAERAAANDEKIGE